jgi:hypothetical protein
VVSEDLTPRLGNGGIADAVELIVHRYTAPSWLPTGSIAEVVSGGTPGPPMAMVRLLLRQGRSVFCVPREGTGALDLPTRRVMCPGDGVDEARALASEVTLTDTEVEYVGCVRNIVMDRDEDYEWPAPIARFGVWRTEEPPRVPGVWCEADDSSPLATRHWYPLLSRIRAGS